MHEKTVEVPGPLHHTCRLIALKKDISLKEYIKQKILEGVNRDQAEDPSL